MRRLYYCLLALTIAGCSTTAEIKRAWVDPDIFEKDLSGTLVVAVSENDYMRNSFEDKFLDILTKKGIRAKVSHKIGGKSIKSEAIIAYANEHKLDTVLVTHYVGSTELDMYHRGTVTYRVAPGGYYSNFNRYYGHVYEVGRTPAFYTTNKHLILVTTLYETASKEILWTATSSAQQGRDPEKMFVPFIDSFVDQMIKDGLVK